jgi:predicted TIM-barrel fold metal-dependent hydrolase
VFTKPCTWQERPADLLIAEMDHAGVDKAILISYDAEDILWYLQRKRLGVEDFAGGSRYTQDGVRRFPDRFVWYVTIKDPRRYDTVSLLREAWGLGAKGIKVFPAYIRCHLDSPEMLKVFTACTEMQMQALISFEDIEPPATLDLGTYLKQLDVVLERYPTTNFGLVHGGCADPLSSSLAEMIVELTRRHPNLYLSTAKVGNIWDDGVEYPFARYLRRLEILSGKVGAGKLMWASDWPWYSDVYLYEQLVEAIRRHASFWAEEEKAEFLGGTASRFLRLP